MSTRTLNFLFDTFRILLAVLLVSIGHPYWALVIAFVQIEFS